MQAVFLALFLVVGRTPHPRPALNNDELLQKLNDAISEIENLRADLKATQQQLDQTKIDLKTLQVAKTELSDDLVHQGDLRKYQRKPDEHELKIRFNGEFEIHTAFTDYRKDTINQLEAFDALTSLPTLSSQSRALIGQIDQIRTLLKENNEAVRPRAMLRLYWEADRFIGGGDDYLFAYVQPEFTFFLLPDDIDRYLLARNYAPDFAHPRDQLGFLFKKAAIGGQFGGFNFSAGVLQFTYGSGFFINPTNPFTPKNPLDPRREVDGIPAVQIEGPLVSREQFTLAIQTAATVSQIRNDVLGLYTDKLGLAGLAAVKMTTPYFSLTGLGIYEAPNANGEDAPSGGGILSFTPFGLTLSGEALWTKSLGQEKWLPELVASFMAFASGLGPAGTTFILEYYRDWHSPYRLQDLTTQEVSAVLKGQQFVAIDLLIKPLGLDQYADFYFEPSLTEKLKLNLSGIVGIDSFGGLGRIGLDYQFSLLTIHLYGGATYGKQGTEFNQYLIAAFAELGLTMTF